MSRIINVAYIGDYPFSIAFGGKEVQMLTYEAMINKQYSAEIRIIRFDPWDKEMLQNLDIIHLFGHNTWFYDLAKPLKTERNIKIINSPTFYVSNYNTMKAASLVSNLIPIPNYFSYKKGFFHQCDSIIVNSLDEKNQIQCLFGVDLGKKIKVVYNSIERDYKEFREISNINCFLNKYSLDPGYLLCVAFLDERKNTIKLIQAFLSCYQEIRKKLVLIGDYRFLLDSNRRITQKLIDDNHDKVIHIPYINRYDDLLKSAYYHCSAHLLPSILETPGLSNLEALYFNKPILVGKCKPVEEYFHEYAIYCDQSSRHGIMKGIKEIVSISNNNEYSSLVEKKYLLDNNTTKLKDIYYKVTNC